MQKASQNFNSRKRVITIVPKSAILPGFGILIICFQMVGMFQWLSERLYR